MTPRKFERGAAIRSPAALAALLDAGHWFYWCHDPRPKHPSVLISMTFRTLMQAAKRGRLVLAIRRTQSPEGK